MDESKSHSLGFSQYWIIGQPIPSITLVLYSDSATSTAPIQKTNNVIELVRLTANLSGIPFSAYSNNTLTGVDGKRYYKVTGTIEATYYSASTKYVLEVEGKQGIIRLLDWS